MPRKKKIQTISFGIRIPIAHLHEIEKLAEQSSKNRNAVVKEAIASFLCKKLKARAAAAAEQRSTKKRDC